MMGSSSVNTLKLLPVARRLKKFAYDCPLYNFQRAASSSSSSGGPGSGSGHEKEPPKQSGSNRTIYTVGALAAIGGLAYGYTVYYNETYDKADPLKWAQKHLGLSSEETKVPKPKPKPVSDMKLETMGAGLGLSSPAKCAGKESEDEKHIDSKMDKKEESIPANSDVKNVEPKPNAVKSADAGIKTDELTTGDFLVGFPEFQRKLIEMKEFYEAEMMKALIRQAQVHQDTLERSKELMREDYERRIKQNSDIVESERLVELREKFTKASSALTAVRKVLIDRKEEDEHSEKSRKLWTYCSNLYNRINYGDKFDDISINKDQLLKDFAGDEFALELVKSIPNRIESIEHLRSRFFNKVDNTCRNVAVFRQDENLSLGKYFWGYIQGSLTARCDGDSDSVSTIYEILDKTAFHLRRGELFDAVSTLNKTEGPARVICKDWLLDARAVLETSQTLFALMTYCNAQNYIP